MSKCEWKWQMNSFKDKIKKNNKNPRKTKDENTAAKQMTCSINNHDDGSTRMFCRHTTDVKDRRKCVWKREAGCDKGKIHNKK